MPHFSVTAARIDKLMATSDLPQPSGFTSASQLVDRHARFSGLGLLQASTGRQISNHFDPGTSFEPHDRQWLPRNGQHLPLAFAPDV